MTGDHAVTGIGMLTPAQSAPPAYFQHIKLFKTTVIQQEINALPGAEFALPVLPRRFLFPARGNRFGTQVL
jgi:hypothetical protein